MNKLVLRLGLISMLFVFIMQVGYGQTTFKLQANPHLEVSGTSSLHDWEMTSNQASGTIKAIVESGKLKDIQSLEVTMPGESIKSGKRGMDKKAYEALKTNKHKSVVFVLKSASKSGNNWILDGSFQIAGKTKNVKITAVETSSSGSYGLKGSYEFKLTDYDMTPPTAVMGTIKTGDEVKINFDLKFN